MVGGCNGIEVSVGFLWEATSVYRHNIQQEISMLSAC